MLDCHSVRIARIIAKPARHFAPRYCTLKVETSTPLVVAITTYPTSEIVFTVFNSPGNALLLTLESVCGFLFRKTRALLLSDFTCHNHSPFITELFPSSTPRKRTVADDLREPHIPRAQSRAEQEGCYPFKDIVCFVDKTYPLL